MDAATVPQDDALERQMHALGRAARDAARRLGTVPAAAKDQALRAAAAAVRADSAAIAAANVEDVAAAEAKGGLSEAMLDRLRLDAKRIGAMADGLEEVAALPDPVGRELARWTRPNGLDIARVAVPLGVVGSSTRAART
jgi:glutamate-5-semialdehyde dehydrogenase